MTKSARILVGIVCASVLATPGASAQVEERTVDGVAIVCDPRVCSMDRAAAIVLGFNESVKACIEKERMIDLLGSDAMLWEVHDLIASYGSNEHVVDIDPSLLESIKDAYMRSRDTKTRIRFKSASFLDYDDVLAQLRAGKEIGGLAYNAEEGTIEAEFQVGSPQWQQGIVLPVRGPQYDMEAMEELLGGVVKGIDQVLDHEAKLAALRYVYAKAEACSRARFDFIDDRQKWFHIGYGGYVTYMVARHYIGEKETNELWQRVYSSKSTRTIPEAAVFAWSESEYDRRALVWLAQRVFFNANKRVEFDGVAELLGRIDARKEDISSGRITVKSLFEEHLSCSMLDLLQGKAAQDPTES